MQPPYQPRYLADSRAPAPLSNSFSAMPTYNAAVAPLPQILPHSAPGTPYYYQQQQQGNNYCNNGDFGGYGGGGGGGGWLQSVPYPPPQQQQQTLSSAATSRVGWQSLSSAHADDDDLSSSMTLPRLRSRTVSFSADVKDISTRAHSRHRAIPLLSQRINHHRRSNSSSNTSTNGVSFSTSLEEAQPAVVSDGNAPGQAQAHTYPYPPYSGDNTPRQQQRRGSAGTHTVSTTTVSLPSVRRQVGAVGRGAPEGRNVGDTTRRPLKTGPPSSAHGKGRQRPTATMTVTAGNAGSARNPRAGPRRIPLAEADGDYTDCSLFDASDDAADDAADTAVAAVGPTDRAVGARPTASQRRAGTQSPLPFDSVESFDAMMRVFSDSPRKHSRGDLVDNSMDNNSNGDTVNTTDNNYHYNNNGSTTFLTSSLNNSLDHVISGRDTASQVDSVRFSPAVDFWNVSVSSSSGSGPEPPATDGDANPPQSNAVGRGTAMLSLSGDGASSIEGGWGSMLGITERAYDPPFLREDPSHKNADARKAAAAMTAVEERRPPIGPSATATTTAQSGKVLGPASTRHPPRRKALSTTEEQGLSAGLRKRNGSASHSPPPSNANINSSSSNSTKGPSWAVMLGFKSSDSTDDTSRTTRNSRRRRGNSNTSNSSNGRRRSTSAANSKGGVEAMVPPWAIGPE